MLNTTEKGRPVASRVKGWHVVVRGLQRDLIRVHRFANRRATTSQQQLRCARVMDALYHTLAIATDEPPPAAKK